MSKWPLLISVFLLGCGVGDVEVYNGSNQPGDVDSGTRLDAGVPTDLSRRADFDSEAPADTSDAASDSELTEERDVGQPPDVGEGDCPRVRVKVEPGNTLNVRPQPNTDQPPVGALYFGMVATVIAEVSGQAINGNATWYEVEVLDLRGYVSAEFAECTLDPVTELAPPTAFYLPLECDKSARISQGNNGDFSHMGRSQYAWDFSVGLGTPLTAIADGIVIATYDGTAPGSACDGGGQECVRLANHVVLLHGDDTTSTYRHLSRVDVAFGEFVPRGIAVGLSGQTGWSTGPHAHVMRMENCGSKYPPEESVCQSIPTSFADVSVNGGVPRTGDTVTSGNCIPLR